MSKSRQPQPVLADYKLFVFYRWFSWLIAGGLLIWQGMHQYVLLLMLAAVVNLLATLLSQSYIRLAQKLPALMSLDVVYCVVMLYMSGGWAGPMGLYALSGLVLPALLYGWRGGFMAGLLVDSLGIALYLANGVTPADMMAQNQQIELLMTLTVGPIFGFFFPSVIDLLRRSLEQRAQARRLRPPFAEPRIERTPPLDGASRSSARIRDHERRPHGAAELQAARNTAVRTAEPNTEELRRALCAPFLPSETDLQTVVGLLADRFRSHTGAVTRVTVLGRARTLAFAQQSVLVRLLQEALLNVQQHAQATRVELTLRYDTLSVALLIQDNGIGLVDGTHDRSGVRALRAMQYRLSELDGRLDVFETEGGGVTVRATAPLE